MHNKYPDVVNISTALILDSLRHPVAYLLSKRNYLASSIDSISFINSKDIQLFDAFLEVWSDTSNVPVYAKNVGVSIVPQNYTAYSAKYFDLIMCNYVLTGVYSNFVVTMSRICSYLFDSSYDVPVTFNTTWEFQQLINTLDATTYYENLEYLYNIRNGGEKYLYDVAIKNLSLGSFNVDNDPNVDYSIYTEYDMRPAIVEGNSNIFVSNGLLKPIIYGSRALGTRRFIFTDELKQNSNGRVSFGYSDRLETSYSKYSMRPIARNYGINSSTFNLNNISVGKSSNAFNVNNVSIADYSNAFGIGNIASNYLPFSFTNYVTINNIVDSNLDADCKEILKVIPAIKIMEINCEIVFGILKLNSTDDGLFKSFFKSQDLNELYIKIASKYYKFIVDSSGEFYCNDLSTSELNSKSYEIYIKPVDGLSYISMYATNLMSGGKYKFYECIDYSSKLILDSYEFELIKIGNFLVSSIVGVHKIYKGYACQVDSNVPIITCGKYNLPTNGGLIYVGNGVSTSSRSNIFELNKWYARLGNSRISQISYDYINVDETIASIGESHLYYGLIKVEENLIKLTDNSEISTLRFGTNSQNIYNSVDTITLNSPKVGLIARSSMSGTLIVNNMSAVVLNGLFDLTQITNISASNYSATTLTLENLSIQGNANISLGDIANIFPMNNVDLYSLGLTHDVSQNIYTAFDDVSYSGFRSNGSLEIKLDNSNKVSFDVDSSGLKYVDANGSVHRYIDSSFISTFNRGYYFGSDSEYIKHKGSLKSNKIVHVLATFDENVLKNSYKSSSQSPFLGQFGRFSNIVNYSQGSNDSNLLQINTSTILSNVNNNVFEKKSISNSIKYGILSNIVCKPNEFVAKIQDNSVDDLRLCVSLRERGGVVDFDICYEFNKKYDSFGSNQPIKGGFSRQLTTKNFIVNNNRKDVDGRIPYISYGNLINQEISKCHNNILISIIENVGLPDTEFSVYSNYVGGGIYIRDRRDGVATNTTGKYPLLQISIIDGNMVLVLFKPYLALKNYQNTSADREGFGLLSSVPDISRITFAKQDAYHLLYKFKGSYVK